MHYNIKLLSNTLDIDNTIGHYFALLHDVARKNEEKDIGHGQRAVELLSAYGGHEWLQITAQAYEELCYAITHHSNGLTEGTLTQQACWDADRLDLWRVGIMPNPGRLITEAAKDLHYDRLYEGYYR